MLWEVKEKSPQGTETSRIRPLTYRGPQIRAKMDLDNPVNIVLLVLSHRVWGRRGHPLICSSSGEKSQ